MGIATLFRSPFANVDLTKFGPTHWNQLRDLVTRLLDTPTDLDGSVLIRDSTSINGAKWGPGGGGGGAAPPGTGYTHVTAGVWDVPVATIPQAGVTTLVADLAARELVANKNAASGYAGLSVGSKLDGTQQTYGTAANTACVGNDARLSDARVPTAHTHPESDVVGLVADLGTLTTAVAARELLANKNAANGYAGLSGGSKLAGSQQTYGSTANTACEGNDARLSDARTPTAHVHPESDVINLVADLAARPTLTGAQVLTNKQITPRVQAVASAATVTPSPDTDDLVVVTAQAAALTLANPTPVVNVAQGQKLIIRIKDNGTARAISYGTQYRTLGPALPTTTIISKTLYLGLIYNATDTKWDLVAVAQEP